MEQDPLKINSLRTKMVLFVHRLFSFVVFRFCGELPVHVWFAMGWLAMDGKCLLFGCGYGIITLGRRFRGYAHALHALMRYRAWPKNIVTRNIALFVRLCCCGRLRRHRVIITLGAACGAVQIFDLGNSAHARVARESCMRSMCDERHAAHCYRGYAPGDRRKTREERGMAVFGGRFCGGCGVPVA